MTDFIPLTREERDELDTHARSFPRAMLSRVWLELKAIREERPEDYKDKLITDLRAALRPFANLHVEYGKADTQLYGRATPSGNFHITNADIDHAHRVLDDVGI